MNWPKAFPAVLGVLCLLSGSGVAARAEPVSVFVSLLPQKYFVERIGGDHVEVGIMVPPGQSPATYEPTPKQMAQLADAAVYFRIGVPFEDVWIERISAANPIMKMVDAREGITLREMDTHDDEQRHAGDHNQAAGEARKPEAESGHDHGRYDPHIWTAPPLVKIMAARIRDTLSALDPDHGSDYEANYARFAADLDALDKEIRQKLEAKKARRFMVYHPAWGYFADTYGLKQIPIETEGKEPGAKQLAGLVERAKADGIRIIVVQQQFGRRNAEAVAAAIDGRVVSVDPLAENYLENTRAIANTFAEALR
jgi:zinc transport system substrate-binding protein